MQLLLDNSLCSELFFKWLKALFAVCNHAADNNDHFPLVSPKTDQNQVEFHFWLSVDLKRNRPAAKNKNSKKDTRLTFPTGLGINLLHGAIVPESHVQMQRLMYIAWKEIRQGWGRNENAQIWDSLLWWEQSREHGEEKKSLFDI